jgi:hypothetical protein
MGFASRTELNPFYGRDDQGPKVEEFIARAEATQLSLNWDDAHLNASVQTYCRSDAFDFIQEIKRGLAHAEEYSIDSWTQTKAALLARFGDRTTASGNIQLLKDLKQQRNETIRAFEARVASTVARLMTEINRVSAVMNATSVPAEFMRPLLRVLKRAYLLNGLTTEYSQQMTNITLDQNETATQIRERLVTFEISKKKASHSQAHAITGQEDSDDDSECTAAALSNFKQKKKDNKGRKDLINPRNLRDHRSRRPTTGRPSAPTATVEDTPSRTADRRYRTRLTDTSTRQAPHRSHQRTQSPSTAQRTTHAHRLQRPRFTPAHRKMNGSPAHRKMNGPSTSGPRETIGEASKGRTFLPPSHAC